MIVLSPHFDDAALSTFAKLDEAKAVVNVFTDAPEGSLSTWDRVCGHSDSAVVARARREEDNAALASLGVLPINLSLRDAGVRESIGEAPPEVAPLAGLIADAIDGYGEVVLLAPLGGGPVANPDHVLVREAALTLHRARRVSVVLYADQPYVYKNRSWPNFVTGSWNSFHTELLKSERGEIVEPPSDARWWDRFPRAVPEMISLTNGIEVVRLSEQDRDRKLALMQRYETQFENLNRKLRTRNLLRDPECWGVEVYWTLDPPARLQEAA